MKSTMPYASLKEVLMKTGEAIPLLKFMEWELKKIYSRHLADTIPNLVSKFCFGCLKEKHEDKYHQLCLLDHEFQIRFCMYHALDKVNEIEVMEEYGEVVGIGGLEWVEIFDEKYRREDWMMTESWHNDVVGLVMQRWLCRSEGKGVSLTKDGNEGDSQLLSQVVADQIPSESA